MQKGLPRELPCAVSDGFLGAHQTRGSFPAPSSGFWNVLLLLCTLLHQWVHVNTIRFGLFVIDTGFGRCWVPATPQSNYSASCVGTRSSILYRPSSLLWFPFCRVRAARQTPLHAWKQRCRLKLKLKVNVEGAGFEDQLIRAGRWVGLTTGVRSSSQLQGTAENVSLPTPQSGILCS